MSQPWLTALTGAAVLSAFAMTVKHWTRQLRPGDAVRALAMLSMAVTLAGLATLLMLALPLVGQSDLIDDRAHWSEAVFRRINESGQGLAILAAAAVGLAALRVFRVILSCRRARVAANALCTDLGAAAGDTVIVRSPHRDAMAISSGIIVMTDALVRDLNVEQRRAVIAHERSHLSHDHHRYLQLGLLIAAANPLLRTVPDALAFLVERWADEDAARATSRATTAAALERLAHPQKTQHPSVLIAIRAAATAVEDRLAALRTPTRPVRVVGVLSPALLAIASIAIACLVAEHTVDLFRLAVTAGHRFGMHPWRHHTQMIGARRFQ